MISLTSHNFSFHPSVFPLSTSSHHCHPRGLVTAAITQGGGIHGFFFFFGIGQLCANQNTKPFLFRAPIVVLCSVSIFFKKFHQEIRLRVSWCLCFEGSPRLCRRQQKAASTETCQPSDTMLAECFISPGNEDNILNHLTCN